MKISRDILTLYRSVHSWVGIISGLFLFVAFYAGAVSMFERPLQNYLSFPKSLPQPVPLERAPELLNRTFASYPEAKHDYTVIISKLPSDTRSEKEGVRKAVSLRWPGEGGHHNKSGTVTFSTLDQSGSLVVTKTSLSQTAFFIDILHRQVGLPLSRKPAMIIMGIVALLYSVALVSAVIIYLPVMTRTLFAVRLKAGFRKKWLDFHNLLGFFSLPFHIIMAVTSVVFAFHGEFFALEHALFAPSSSAEIRHNVPENHRILSHPAPLSIPALIGTLQTQAPGFEPASLNYSTRHHQMTLSVAGYDTRYIHRGPTGSFISLDPYDGHILSDDYVPGHQSLGYVILTSLFSLHFGSFGGNFVRWGYVVLGLGGAFLFYTGNHLWIDSRRRQEYQQSLKYSATIKESWGTRFLERLTSGWVFGTITGVSALLCVSLVTSAGSHYDLIWTLYYTIMAVFLLIAWLFPYQMANLIHKITAFVMTLLIPFALIVRMAFLT
ncbi:PepSY-associated TM helix domain-containing protein [Acetobacteraceae bacterium ESL0709]|nr:PepSY-associated TM helix domain-containing protein [Acetobacteraceae bacterium ESL0697]MDF7677521.1 PepSY-associated TM helix domain-containing protein [Acetobacteraceae bacterium ESL0709]